MCKISSDTIDESKDTGFQRRREDKFSENRDLNYETNGIISKETYSSHIGLLSMPVVETNCDISSTEPSLANNFNHDNISTALVFLIWKLQG